MIQTTLNLSRKKPAKTYAWWNIWHWRLWRSRWFWGISLTLLLAIGVAGWFIYGHVQRTMAAAAAVKTQVDSLKVAAKAQDMTAIKTQLPELQTKLNTLQDEGRFFAFTAALPVVGHYYTDAQHGFAGAKEAIIGGQILVQAVEPYSSILGFKSSTVETATLSSEDRIAQLVLIMPSILPALDEATAHFEGLRQQIDQIDPSGYPRQIRGVDVRQTLTQAKSQIDQLEQGMKDSRPLLQILPQALGAQTPKKYLILFQNDKELRPTGGFITSIAYVTFAQGKFTVSQTGDIYQIDSGKAYLPAPKPIIQYLKVPQWNMRDTNFSPDFASSMHDFEYYYDKGNNPKIDGIIAVDTQFVESLMEVTGPLTVAGYKQPFSAEPISINGTQVPQVVYQLELLAEKRPGEPDRKGILGDLMNVMIKKILSDPVTRWGDYLKVGLRDGQEKHVLLSFHDQATQQLAEERNFAGRVVQVAAPEDYLHINDANLAGLKSNFYLTQETRRDIRVADDGTTTEKLTITYKNTGKFDGWINATARNYTRVYVPQGAKLTGSSGGEQRVTTTQDLGKTVFDNFVTVKPLAQATLTFEYTLPFKVTGTYRGLIQKQAGAKNWTYTTTINGASQQTLLDGDHDLSAAL